jgi:hypothetical protein
MDSKAPHLACGLPRSISPNSSILGQITHVLNPTHTQSVFMSSCEPFGLKIGKLVLIG